MKSITLAVLSLCAIPFSAQAEFYLAPSLTAARSVQAFGGYNSAGSISNDDTTHGTVNGIALNAGWRNAWAVDGRSITPEITFAWTRAATSSDSFPGWTYQTVSRELRLGAAFWTPVNDNGAWRTEVGVGAGLLQRDLSTSDNVVGGEDTDVALFGKIGLRGLRELEQGTLSVAVNCVIAGKTSLDLFDAGIPEGNYTYRSTGLELEIGYQIPF